MELLKLSRYYPFDHPSRIYCVIRCVDISLIVFTQTGFKFYQYNHSLQSSIKCQNILHSARNTCTKVFSSFLPSKFTIFILHDAALSFAQWNSLFFKGTFLLAAQLYRYIRILYKQSIHTWYLKRVSSHLHRENIERCIPMMKTLRVLQTFNKI